MLHQKGFARISGPKSGLCQAACGKGTKKASNHRSIAGDRKHSRLEKLIVYMATNFSFLSLHLGQRQSSGRFSNFFPAGTLSLGGSCLKCHYLPNLIIFHLSSMVCLSEQPCISFMSSTDCSSISSVAYVFYLDNLN